YHFAPWIPARRRGGGFVTPTGTPLGFGIFVALLLISLGTFGYLMEARWALLARARPSGRFDRWGERIRGVVSYFMGQKRILDRKYRLVGIMHALIFWGFLAVGINTIHFVGGGFHTGWHLPLLGPASILGRGYALLRDVFEILVLVMILFAAYRR